jgi:hypothetical protein
LQTCPVVVYVTDDQLASFADAGAPGGRVVHCDGGRSGPGRQWVWWVSGEGKPGGGSVEDGGPLHSFGSHSE